MIAEAASTLLSALDERRELSPLTDKWKDLTLEQAYAIQNEMLQRRLARGEKLLGLKLGLTTRAKQIQMGISSPLTAWLTDAMQLAPGVPLPGNELIHPRVEPEIVFVMHQRLAGPGVTAESALRAVGTVRAGIEILDSRYKNFRFTLPDVVADNASSARFVLGSIALPPSVLNLAQEECVLEVNGEVVGSANGSAVQGHPAEAVALAANALAEHNLAIEADWIILTGGMTEAVYITPQSMVKASFSHLGTIAINGGDSSCP